MTDILYVAWNRLTFTRFSFAMLIRNTDWSLVDRLVIHDDGSVDGTLAYLKEAMKACPVDAVLNSDEHLESPPAVMNRMVEATSAARFAKIDNDIVVPPGWLNVLTDVMDRTPDLELLGMEAGRNGPPGHNGQPWGGVYGWVPGSHTGGVGLFQTEAFLKRRKLVEDAGRFGFTEWQHEYQPVRGWVAPDLLVSSLDQIPFDPWRRQSRKYVEKGWQRAWPEYHERWDYWWSWWPHDAAAISRGAVRP